MRILTTTITTTITITITIALVSASLTGCVGSYGGGIVTNGPEPVRVDPKLLVRCDKLSPLNSPADKDVVAWIKDTGIKYAECENRHHGLSEAVKNLGQK
jgi:hypothetical protein